MTRSGATKTAPARKVAISRSSSRKLGSMRGALPGIASIEPHGAPTFGTQHAGMKREAVALDLGAAVVLEHGGDEMPLHIGGRCVGHDVQNPRLRHRVWS